VKKLNAPFITLGVDAGGIDANNATLNHYMKLRSLLAEECSRSYSDSLTEIALVLRVDGSVQSWGRNGVGNVRLQKKTGYATADIFMPSVIWKSGSAREIREFIVAGVQTAVQTIQDKAGSANLNFEYRKLSQDLQSVTATYLKK
jgi:hypothetical protein